MTCIGGSVATVPADNVRRRGHALLRSLCGLLTHCNGRAGYCDVAAATPTTNRGSVQRVIAQAAALDGMRERKVLSA